MSNLRFSLPVLAVAIALMMALFVPNEASAHHDPENDPERGFHSMGSLVLTLEECTISNCTYSVAGSHQTTHVKGGEIQGSITIQNQGSCDYMVANLVLRGPDPANFVTLTGVDSCVGSSDSDEEFYTINGGGGTFLNASGEGIFVADNLLTFDMRGKILFAGNH